MINDHFILCLKYVPRRYVTRTAVLDSELSLTLFNIHSSFIHSFIHEGVLAVLKKHKWSVGALCELYPEGQVGVSDVCVMGLNQNSGQKILLRLRTDDLQGEMMSYNE